MLHLTHLPHQEPGEKVIIYLRRHWFIFAKISAFFIFLSILPLFLRSFIVRHLPQLLSDSMWGPSMTLLISIYYLFIWVLWYQNFLDYYLDLWIVTDRRIINTEQNSLFNRVIAEQRLSRIQDVTSTQKGFLPTFLNYGEVKVQTAGQQPQFHFEQIPNPHEVARHINKFVEYNRVNGH